MAFLSHLILTNFRCYDAAKLTDMSSGLIVLYGPNGAGKTNILEAVSLLTPGRGLRNASLAEIQKNNAPQAWGVASHVDTGGVDVQLGTGIDPQTGKRLVRINGTNAKSQIALADYLSALWLTPQMDRLFLDGASGRRRFFDKLVFTFDPAHAGRVTRYENVMSQRSKLLREGKGDDYWLKALESQMAETGVAIAAARLDFAHLLQKAVLSGDASEEHFFPKARLEMAGTVEELLMNTPAVDVEQMLAYQLSQSRPRDAEYGGASSGPHKSDLKVWFAAKNMPADQCSTGEQKALLIGLVLAHARLIRAEKNTVPLLLLDEIAAHLDEARRAALFERLSHLGGQVWMTGTDKNLFSHVEKSARFLSIESARIISENQ